MAINAGIFGDGTNLKDRYVSDPKKLASMVNHWKELGLRIVLTSGTYDLFHVGHAQYLEQAKKQGDLLIVGVDSDAKVKKRKGPNRPVVSEGERIHILSHLRHVDAITLKLLDEKENALIKLVRPDVLVLSKSTKHKKEDIAEKKKYCGKVVLLPPQAETSTTAKVRLLHVSGAGRFAEDIIPKLSKMVEAKLNESASELAKGIAAEIPKLIEQTLNSLDSGKK
ncbi:MAG TPA: adenylyltransferase/cytidyltransferase family protein [Candidatus Paceibacterota bacterium]